MSAAEAPAISSPSVRLELLVRLPSLDAELAPGAKDKLQDTIEERLTERGVTPNMTTLTQSLDPEQPRGSTGLRLTGLAFTFDEQTLALSELLVAERIISGTIRDIGLPADPDNIYVSAVGQIDLDALEGE